MSMSPFVYKSMCDIFPHHYQHQHIPPYYLKDHFYQPRSLLYLYQLFSICINLTSVFWMIDFYKPCARVEIC